MGKPCGLASKSRRPSAWAGAARTEGRGQITELLSKQVHVSTDNGAFGAAGVRRCLVS